MVFTTSNVKGANEYGFCIRVTRLEFWLEVAAEAEGFGEVVLCFVTFVGVATEVFLAVIVGEEVLNCALTAALCALRVEVAIASTY